MNQAIQDIIAEREHQINEEGFDAYHDDTEETNFGMAAVAGIYALSIVPYVHVESLLKKCWPGTWELRWWKPTTPRRNLVKAGALIIAEIERIDRDEARKIK